MWIDEWRKLVELQQIMCYMFDNIWKYWESKFFQKKMKQLKKKWSSLNKIKCRKWDVDLKLKLPEVTTLIVTNFHLVYLKKNQEDSLHGLNAIWKGCMCKWNPDNTYCLMKIHELSRFTLSGR